MLPMDAIFEVALILATGDDFDHQVNRSLQLVGDGLGVARIAVFLDEDDRTSARNTHEWVAPGFAPLLPSARPFAYAALPGLRDFLVLACARALDRVAALPPALESQLPLYGIRGVMLTPLQVDDRVVGFLALECGRRGCKWTRGEQETVRTIAGLLASAWNRTHLAARVARSEANFRRLFDTMGDIVLVSNESGLIVYANDTAVQKLGYSREALSGMTMLDLYPAARQAEAKRTLERVLAGREQSHPLELANRDGMLIPVVTRVWSGEWDGEQCLFNLSKDVSELRAALRKFEAVFRHNPAAMAVSVARSGVLLDVNEAFLRKFGYDRQELIGHDSRELHLFKDAATEQRVRALAAEHGGMNEVLLEMRRKDGLLRQMRCGGSVVQVAGEDLLVGVLEDVTEELEMQRQLRIAHDRQRNILEGAHLGAWEWNVQTGALVVNERWAGLLGYALDELSPVTIQTWRHLMHSQDLPEAERRLGAHLRGVEPSYEIEFRMRHRDGHWVWIQSSGRVIEHDPAGRPLLMYGTHSDVTARKEMEAQVRNLANRDPLTGLYNRRHLMERLQELLAEHRRHPRGFCVSLLDLDFFKRVNDEHGHLVGDQVLKEFTLAVLAGIRQYDIFARLGGEEFVLVSPCADCDDILQLMERLRAAVAARPLSVGGREVRVTFSAGIAGSDELQGASLTMEALLALADRRLYLAKEAGRDRVVGPPLHAARDVGVA